MRFAYADPPYLGCCHLYDHDHGEGSDSPWPFIGMCWDEPETHEYLIDWLSEHFPDGWAMSLSVPSLRTILPLCPDDARVGAWVKPFASFKPNVNPAYAWEPVIFHGGRERDRTQPTVRDWTAVNITLKRGLTGAKPDDFTHWILALLGVRWDDEFVDLFPGSGAVSKAWERWCRQTSLFAGGSDG